MHTGYKLNLGSMPAYFNHLCHQASKQLNEDDIKSIIKSRTICEDKLESSHDLHFNNTINLTRGVRTNNII